MKIPSSLKFTGKDPGIVGFEKQKLLKLLKEKLKQDNPQNNLSNDSLMGKIPNLLIGSYNYPDVNTGFLAANTFNDEDNPSDWVKNPKIGIKEIILKRQNLANSKFVSNVKRTNKFSDKLKEVSLSNKPLDAEILYEGNIKKDYRFNKDLLPHGPMGILKNLSILENPRIPFHVQRAESDTDLKAKDAINTLKNKGINEHFLTKIISAGNLGLKTQRKIVPTRWAITAIDDTLGKNYLKNISHYENHEYSFFRGKYLGNYYFVIIFPGPWSFELFETYVGDIKNASKYASATDYEGVFGREKYAENTSGGYYASRLAALEYLTRCKMKGKIIMFRFITEDYWAPLGVWVVREASRNAFKNESLKFDNKQDLLNHCFLSALKRFKINIKPLYRESKTLKNISEQQILL